MGLSLNYKVIDFKGVSTYLRYSITFIVQLNFFLLLFLMSFLFLNYYCNICSHSYIKYSNLIKMIII